MKKANQPAKLRLLNDGNAKELIMSSPKQNATPAQMARLAKLNEKLYGPKSGTGYSKSTPAEMGRSMGAPAKSSVSNSEITGYLAKNPGMSDKDIRGAMGKYGVSTKQMSEATGTGPSMPDRPQVNVRPTLPYPMPDRPQVNVQPTPPMGGGMGSGMKRGGSVRKKTEAKFSSGGSTSKASSRGDGIAQRGKTKGRYI
jgi:hypothetical protein